MKILSKRGAGYVDMCVGVVVFVMILVIAINIFSFITLRIEMDRIADELIESATFTGAYGADFDERCNELEDQYFPFYLNVDADEYFNETYSRVQLGHTMTVTVNVDTDIRGIGLFKIPVTLSVTRSGLSQKYWK